MTRRRHRRFAVCACLLAGLLGAAAGAQTAPAVSDAQISSTPDSDGTYELGEVIAVSVTFDRAVDMTGRPQLALTIGTATRQMAALAGTTTIFFFYEVQSSDADADGVSIGANALTLNGGTIKAKDGTDAVLDLGAHAIADSTNHKVDGSRETAPTVNRVNLVDRGTFKLGQDIFVTVSFNRPVDVTGSPQLALTIGSTTRQADYSPSDSTGRVMWFVYTVQSSDADADGISVGANALTLNGGTIKIRGGATDAVLDLGAYAIANSVRHKVDGGQEAESDDETDGGDTTSDNGAPQLAGELLDLELDVGETKTVALAGVFRDPELDPLRFTVSSEGDAVSVGVVSGTAEENRLLVRASLEIRGVRPGEATVAVTATDPGGRSATATFKVLVGALLSLSGDAAGPEGGAAVLTATLNRALAEPLDISWRTAPDGDPSTPDADANEYVSQPGRATIPTGQTTVAIEIAIVDDDHIEPAREYFEVRLDDPRHPNVHVSRGAILAAIQEGVCDRTPAVRDELSRYYAGCHWPKQPDLANVSRLALEGRGIDSLRSKDLLGLAGLASLDLRGNALETLPDGLFAGLGRLREATVEGNPGAPFRLAVELVRNDAEPWAAGPATVSARIAAGAPFVLTAPLRASPVAGAEGLPTMVRVAAGETTGTVFAARQVAGVPLTLRAAAPAMPTTRCGGMPCFRGFEPTPGPALTLFHRPPRALAAPTPEPLFGGSALRLPLDALIAPGDAPDGMRWAASSSDESLARVRISGAALVVDAEPASEGTAQITLTATDALGLAATVRFEVQVEFHWPSGATRGWRATLPAAEDAATQQ